MKSDDGSIIVVCNEAPVDEDMAPNCLSLNYLSQQRHRNLNLGLRPFVRNVYHLPHRVLDLIELAAYLYAADRYSSRGPKDSLEYHSWSRRFQIHCRVRDHDFWSKPQTIETLRQTLLFMTGDESYDFYFYPGHSTPPTSLFDSDIFHIEPGQRPLAVIPFSGGLDSLAGAIQLLSQTDAKVLLASHQSQPGTTRTQNQLASALQDRWPNRILHYRFRCNLAGVRSAEETQRTRSFLYSSIAYAIANAYRQNQFYIYENGMMGINFARRQDQANARASRTTHPKTVRHLEELFSLISEREIKMHLPFLLKTKRDVVTALRQGPHPELISSSVSCSRTFQYLGTATHCGTCLQCIDRRIASYAAKAEDFDHDGLYATNVVTQTIEDAESRTAAVDYVRQAARFAKWNLDHFYNQHLMDLANIVDYLPVEKDEMDRVDIVWRLTRRHADSVSYGLKRMRDHHDDLYEPLQTNSLLYLVSRREHLRPEVERLAESLQKIVRVAVPEMFRVEKPKNEPDLNTKVGALLRTHEWDLRSEHPTVSFACAQVIPDHTIRQADLMVETKYVRKATTPSKVTDAIGSDLSKYPEDSHILFLVYDPEHAIPHDDEFRQDIENKGQCFVCILR